VSEFFRFPHTPHLAWLGAGSPREDKVLDPSQAEALLTGEVTVEEKLDGANLGFSLGEDGQIVAQNRGQYLPRPFSGQFSRLNSWLAQHQDALAAALGKRLMLFGEWCAARHSLRYTKLPDWFLVFDVYDRMDQRFWSSPRRDALAAGLDLAPVPLLSRGRVTLPGLKLLLAQKTSAWGDDPIEGLVVRSEDKDWLLGRAKLVRADFTQAITEHWRHRKTEWNQILAVSRSDRA